VNARIAMADLAAQHRSLLPELEDAMRRVVASSRFILGEEVECFEAAAAEYLGVPHAIGVSSGTDALLMALTALGIGPGDEVITTPFTFVAPAECIARLGARPGFVDINPETLCVDVNQVEAAITPRTRAVMPVHLYGSAADVSGLATLCDARGIALVEDAAQAFGTHAAGRRAGAWGAFGCFSFFPGKVLGALGDAGLIVTSDDALAKRCRRLRQHGSERHGPPHLDIGGNHRLDALQAAFLRVKLPHVDAFVNKRRSHGRRYDAGLSGVGGLTPVSRSSGWNGAVYAVRVRDGRRDALRALLQASDIETAVYYPTPLHLEAAFARVGLVHGALSESERAADEILALPIHSELETTDVDRVVAEVRSFAEGAAHRIDVVSASRGAK
jgi:dTDP-4-amino-4,6-dideoxygalactose transaminase